MKMRRSRTRIPAVSGLVAVTVFLGSLRLRPQEIRMIPHLPLLYEVVFPPTPVTGEGRVHLFYELQMTNVRKGLVSLRSVEMLGEGKTVIKTYQGPKLSECLVRPGQSPDMKDKSIMEGGTHAILFIMLAFKRIEDLPDFLTHRITVEYTQRGGEKVVVQGVGAQMSIPRKLPLQIGSPVRAGVWLAGNGPGDGPVGHRLSLMPWNGRLVMNQRYALDFTKFAEDSRLVHGDSSVNSHWLSYGQEVLAVADGVISGIKDDVVENTPNAPYAVGNTLDTAAGNYVVLNIGPGAYAVYAHLQPKSLRVKTGDKVHKGQVLGLIGNTGISDAPHLHFHLLDSDSVFGGESVPYVFERFELLGAFDNLDENLEKRWVSRGKPSLRTAEIPLGDVVIRFF